MQNTALHHLASHIHLQISFRLHILSLITYSVAEKNSVHHTSHTVSACFILHKAFSKQVTFH